MAATKAQTNADPPRVTVRLRPTPPISWADVPILAWFLNPDQDLCLKIDEGSYVLFVEPCSGVPRLRSVGAHPDLSDAVARLVSRVVIEYD